MVMRRPQYTRRAAAPLRLCAMYRFPQMCVMRNIPRGARWFYSQHGICQYPHHDRRSVGSNRLASQPGWSRYCSKAWRNCATKKLRMKNEELGFFFILHSSLFTLHSLHRRDPGVYTHQTSHRLRSACPAYGPRAPRPRCPGQSGQSGA